MLLPPMAGSKRTCPCNLPVMPVWQDMRAGRDETVTCPRPLSLLRRSVRPACDRIAQRRTVSEASHLSGTACFYKVGESVLNVDGKIRER